MAAGIEGKPSASADFEEPTLSAKPCEFSLGLPSFSFGIKLPSLTIPFPDLSFYLNFELSCDLSKPINVSAGLPFGGGKVATASPDPDDDPNT